MSKKMRMSVITIALSLLFVFFIGCGNTLSGKYVADDILHSTMEFTSDGKVSIGAFGISADGTYEIKGSEIRITYTILGADFSLTKDFERNGNSIVIDGMKFKKN